MENQRNNSSSYRKNISHPYPIWCTAAEIPIRYPVNFVKQETKYQIANCLPHSENERKRDNIWGVITRRHGLARNDAATKQKKCLCVHAWQQTSCIIAKHTRVSSMFHVGSNKNTLSIFVQQPV